MSRTSSVNTPNQARVDRRLVVLVALALLALVLVMADPNALCLLPALALAVPLLLRRYPGEKMLTALSVKPSSRRARTRSSAAPRWLPVRSGPRGGLLLASSLAVRPPPSW